MTSCKLSLMAVTELHHQLCTYKTFNADQLSEIDQLNKQVISQYSFSGAHFANYSYILLQHSPSRSVSIIPLWQTFSILKYPGIG